VDTKISPEIIVKNASVKKDIPSREQWREHIKRVRTKSEKNMEIKPQGQLSLPIIPSFMPENNTTTKYAENATGPERSYSAVALVEQKYSQARSLRSRSRANMYEGQDVQFKKKKRQLLIIKKFLEVQFRQEGSKVKKFQQIPSIIGRHFLMRYRN